MQVALRIIQFAGFSRSSDLANLPLDTQRLQWVAPQVQPAYSKRELAERSSAVMRSALLGASQDGKTKVKLVDGPRVPLPSSQASSDATAEVDE